MSSAAIDVTFDQASMDAVDALDPLFTNMEADVADRVSGALYAGLLNGTNPNDLAGQLVDCLSPARAQLIARTEMLGAYRTAALDAYRANSDVVGQWMWSSARGGACIACLEMDGEVFSLDEEMDGMTHPNCRCSPIPITSSWGDILGPLGIDSSDIADTSILDDYQTGAEWFAQQDAATQIDALGSKAAYEAVQAGEVSPRDFVGVRHDAQYGDSIYTKSLKEALTPTFNPAAVEQYQQGLTELDQLLADLRASRIGMDERAALDALNADDVVPKAANRLGGADSRYYRMTIDDHDYFVKVPREPLTMKGITYDFASLARTADDAARLLGMDDLALPTRIIENDAGTFAVSPWVDGTQMSRAELRAAVQAMSAQDVQREALYEYLLGDTDRSLSGYLVTPDGGLRAFDFEGAFDTVRGVSQSNLLGLIAVSDDEFAQMALDRTVMQDFIDQAGALRDVFVRDGLSDAELAAYDQRVQMLRDALAQDRPAVYDLINPDSRKYFVDTSQPFDRSNLVTIGQREAAAAPSMAARELTADDLKAALDSSTLQDLGRDGFNQRYRATIDGQDYFIKQLIEQPGQQAAAEIASDQMMSQAGFDAYRLGGLQSIELDGKYYLVQPWVDGATPLSLVDDPAAALRAAMSQDDRQGMSLLNYLTGDEDRTAANYLRLEDGRIVSIDHGLAFDTEGFVVDAHTLTTDALAQGLTSQDISDAALRNLLDQRDDLLQAARDAGVSSERYDALVQRFDILQQFQENGGGTLSDFERFASTATPRDTSLAAPRISQAAQELRDAQAALRQAVQSGAGRQDVLAAQWDVAKKQAAIDLENGGRGVNIIVRGADPLDTSKLDQSMQDLFGRNLSRDEIGGLVGAPQGSFVEVYPGNDGLAIITHGPDYDPMAQNEASFNSIRYISRDPATGDLMASNTSFAVREDLQGQGLGLRIFADQVDTLSKLDVRYIETTAAGAGPNAGLTPGTFSGGANGYYTWPRFGYNGPLPAEAIRIIREAIQAGDLPSDWAGFRSISDVMEAPGGREWWKVNGVPLHLRFDLTDGSYSRQTLEEYLKQRGLQ